MRFEKLKQFNKILRNNVTQQKVLSPKIKNLETF